MLSSKFGHSLDPIVLRIHRYFLGNRKISPNIITVVGLLFALAASVSVATGRLLQAGVLLLLAGAFDVLDGAIARNTNTVTPFGGFFDSVLDRYSDLFVMLGILLFFLQSHDLRYVAVTGVASIGVAIVPYARARAEAAGVNCRNGLMERPERIVLLILGLCFDALRITVVILAVFTHVTIGQRVCFVRKAMKSL